MAVRKIQLPDGTVENVNDSRLHIYRTLTGTDAVTSSPYYSARWDVIDDTVTSYEDGMIVWLEVPVAGNGSYGTCLQINSLGYKPIVYNVNSMISTRYSVGSMIIAMYNATQTATAYFGSGKKTVTGCWQVMDYDSNSTSISNLYHPRGTRVVTGGDLKRYVLCVEANETGLIPLNGTGTTATTKTMTTESFDPTREILYYTTNATIAEGDSVALSGCFYSNTLVDLRYSFNSGTTLTANKEVYMVMDVQSDGRLCKLASTPWSQTLPTSNDGHVYMLLGFTQDTYRAELYPHHPMYYHDGTSLKIWQGAEVNVQSDWNQTDTTADDYIKNKPTIPDAVSGVNDGTNWTSITIGSTTKAIPSGGGSSLPSQTGNSGKFLSTDGTDASWESIPDNVFVVTLYKDENENFTCSSTPDDIMTEFNAGKFVLLIYDYFDSWEKEQYICRGGLYSIGTGGIIFFGQTSENGTILSPKEVSFSSIVYISDTSMFTVPGLNAGWNVGTSLNLSKPDWNATSGSSGEILNKPTIPTTIASLTGDVNISSPTDGQILKYDNTSSKWVNANAEKEIFWCTMTSTTENNTTTWSCDKTWSEIYAAHQDDKLVCLKAGGVIHYASQISQDHGQFTFVTYLYFFTANAILFKSFVYDNNSWTDSTGLLNTDTLLEYPSSDSGSAGQVLTIGNNSNSNYLYWADVPTELPSITGNANKILAVNNGATGVEWVTKPSSGLTNYDFTHTSNTTISGSTTTVTFAANTRGSAMLTISADLGLTVACNNGSDNYIWITNTGSAEVDVTISAVTKNSTAVSNVYVPSDGITVPAGGVCEIGVIVNTDGAFITSRNDLAL